MICLCEQHREQQVKPISRTMRLLCDYYAVTIRFRAPTNNVPVIVMRKRKTERESARFEWLYCICYTYFLMSTTSAVGL